jgi:hypothetical protein
MVRFRLTAEILVLYRSYYGHIKAIAASPENHP